MRQAKYIFPLLLLFVGFNSCQLTQIPPSTSCEEPTGFSINANHPKAAQIQAKIDEYLAKGLPGMNILIWDPNGFWYQSGGYADLENGIKMQPCHILKLGSVTKMMISTLLWLLIQDGLVEIDDLMQDYIPEVASRIQYGDEITLAMLVDHSSGVYDFARDLGFSMGVIHDFSKSWTAEEILAHLEGKDATHRPGRKVQYSNSNTLLLTMVMEAITGRPHGELFQERILDPLGMDQTVYYNYQDDFPYEWLAQGYLDLYNNGQSIQNVSNLNPGSGHGFTGVYSTVFDLYRFHHALFVEKSLISQENLDRIFASMGQHGDGFITSIGGIIDERRSLFEPGVHSYGHIGGDIGYSANLSYFPHNQTIFAATYNYGMNLWTNLSAEVYQLQNDLFEIMAE